MKIDPELARVIRELTAECDYMGWKDEDTHRLTQQEIEYRHGKEYAKSGKGKA